MSPRFASTLTKRFNKSLGIELGVIEKQLKDGGKTSVMVMDSPGKRKTHILMRGEYNNPGEEVTAGVPEMFAQLPEERAADRDDGVHDAFGMRTDRVRVQPHQHTCGRTADVGVLIGEQRVVF